MSPVVAGGSAGDFPCLLFCFAGSGILMLIVRMATVVTDGVDEKGIVTSMSGDSVPAVSAGDVIVRVDPGYFRPAEVESLLGDASKAREKLGWSPEISLEEMIEEMVASYLEEARRHAHLKRNGFEIRLSREA